MNTANVLDKELFVRIIGYYLRVASTVFLFAVWYFSVERTGRHYIAQSATAHVKANKDAIHKFNIKYTRKLS